MDTRTKVNSASLALGSCLLSEITGGTRHWFASPVCPLQARPACRSRIASCYITCVRYCMYYSLRAPPALVASVTIVISCSCRTRPAKSGDNVYSYHIKYPAVRDYFYSGVDMGILSFIQQQNCVGRAEFAHRRVAY